jgi:hypothetical protein
LITKSGFQLYDLHDSTYNKKYDWNQFRHTLEGSGNNIFMCILTILRGLEFLVYMYIRIKLISP